MKFLIERQEMTRKSFDEMKANLMYYSTLRAIESFRITHHNDSNGCDYSYAHDTSISLSL